MIHSLFIVNQSGDIFLEKHWKSVISRSIVDYFFDAQNKVSFDFLISKSSVAIEVINNRFKNIYTMRYLGCYQKMSDTRYLILLMILYVLFNTKRT